MNVLCNKMSKMIMFLLACLLFAGCAMSSPPNSDDYCAAAEALRSTDYSKNENWIIKNDDMTHNADVFYVYPTMINDYSLVNMDWRIPLHQTRAEMNSKFNTSIFNGIANIFSPYYRQLSLPAAQDILFGNKLNSSHYKLAFRDVEAAFLYYMEHYNNGRPVILLGHSQGSFILIELMKKYFSRPEYADLLVAAYLPGWFITQNDLEKYNLKFAENADDTGVIVIWNTYAPNPDSDGVFNRKGNLGINPMNWRRDGTIATKELQLGKAVYQKGSATPKELKTSEFSTFLIPESGILIADVPDKENYVIPPLNDPTSLHGGDISLFYGNIRANAIQRINNYLRDSSKTREKRLADK